MFTNGSDTAEIPLAKLGPVSGIKVIYPVTEDCGYTLEAGVLKVRMPGSVCARLFEISLA